MLIDLVANGMCGCLFWHVTWRARHFNGSPAFSERVPIMYTPTSQGTLLLSMDLQKPNGNLTRLSPPRVRVCPARLETEGGGEPSPFIS